MEDVDNRAEIRDFLAPMLRLEAGRHPHDKDLITGSYTDGVTLPVSHPRRAHALRVANPAAIDGSCAS